MKLKSSFFCWLGMCVSFCSFAQSSESKYRKVDIGETIPDVQVIDVHTGTSTQLSKYSQGKVTLLDFWATWCVPCIKGLPKMDSLKAKYRDKLEVVAVGYEQLSKLKAFLNGNENLRDLSIPIVANDTLLSKILFPHRTIPHIVWLNQVGQVIAITAQDQVSEKNIVRAIRDSTLSLKSKTDAASFSLAKNIETADSNFLFRSVLQKAKYGNPTTGFIEPITPISEFSSKVRRLALSNFSVSDLYMFAAYKFKVPKNNLNRLVLETKDSIKYLNPALFPQLLEGSEYKDKFEWFEDNIYTYELILPKEVSEEKFYRYMLEDLNRMFGIEGALEKRLVECLVIIKNDPKFTFSKERSAPQFVKSNKPSYIAGIKNMKMVQFVEFLNRFNSGRPIVDQTNISEPIDLPISLKIANDFDILSSVSEFRKLGLDVVVKKIEIDILVLRDK